MNKHFQYLKYVLRHKWYVFQECLKYGLVWRGIKHDWTKFLPSEWFAYVEYFYTDRRSTEWFSMTRKWGLAELAPWGESVQDHFKIAWNHHQKRNDHHWQYWILTEDNGHTWSLPMPDDCRKEMLADWRGAGKALGKPNTLEWYEANKDRIKLHNSTREWVEAELDIETG
jgi:hypothetical protein